MSSAGATIKVQSIRTCVVYDRETGHIHHCHRVVTLAGGHEPEERKIADDALKALRNRRNPPVNAEFGVLHFADDVMKPDKNYRVDIHKQILVLLSS